MGHNMDWSPNVPWEPWHGMVLSTRCLMWAWHTCIEGKRLEWHELTCKHKPKLSWPDLLREEVIWLSYKGWLLGTCWQKASWRKLLGTYWEEAPWVQQPWHNMKGMWDSLWLHVAWRDISVWKSVFS